MVSGYEILDELGKGAFGTVHKAWSETDQCYVAIKKIPLLGRNVNKKRIDQEAKLSEKVCHPNLIRSISHFERDGFLHLVMELCEDGNLRELIHSRGGHLSEDDARDVLCQLVAGVSELHRHNIIHRDLSTANVFVQSRGKRDGREPIRVKIGDFGLSTVLQPNKVSSSFVGNPPFIAPEVATGAGYREEADVWSLGSVFYHCLTGTAPFGETKEGLQKTVNGERNPAGEARLKRCSHEAQDLVNRMLQLNPRNRIHLPTVLASAFCQRSPFAQAGDPPPRRSRQPLLPRNVQSRDSGMGESDRGGSAFRRSTDVRRRVSPSPLSARRPGPPPVLSVHSYRGTQEGRSVDRQSTRGRSVDRCPLPLADFGAQRASQSGGEDAFGTQRLAPRTDKVLETRTAMTRILTSGELVFERLQEHPPGSGRKVVTIVMICRPNGSILSYRPRTALAEFKPASIASDLNCKLRQEWVSADELGPNLRPNLVYALNFVNRIAESTPKVTLHAANFRACLMETGAFEFRITDGPNTERVYRQRAAREPIQQIRTGQRLSETEYAQLKLMSRWVATLEELGETQPPAFAALPAFPIVVGSRGPATAASLPATQPLRRSASARVPR